MSDFLKLNFNDILKGLLMAVLAPAIVIIEQSLSSGVLTFDWKTIALASLGGGVGYLIKNFFTKPTE